VVSGLPAAPSGHEATDHDRYCGLSPDFCIYYGLWYPIVIAVMTAILGTFFLPETKDRDIHHT
jgi:hypothetical protein